MKNAWNIVKKTIVLCIPYRIRQIFPECIYKHLHFKGKFSARLNGSLVCKIWSDGNMVENQIFWKGLENSHERLSMKIWIKVCQITEPQIIWDVGCNTGVYGLVAKRLSPNSKVLLFDPLSSAIKIAQKNFEMNRISGEFHNVALGNFSGKSAVYLENNETFAYSVTVGKNLTGSKKVSALEINVRRADEFIFHKTKIPNLIKMDVETFEPEVLRGFANLDLTNCLFLIEILSDEIGTQIQEILTPENFIYININDKIDKCRFQINLSKSDYYNFVLIPKKIYGKEHAQIMDFVKKFVS